jgi:5-(carboxyamino)imidazole ribonucleotide mutase
VPVACVGIDNARNGALLAVEILALADESLREKMVDYRRKRARASSPRT